ncbi:unnamed protein product, partial [marine sediment metagenome]
STISMQSNGLLLSTNIIGKVMVAKIVKANYRDNILTALIPHN